MKAKENNLKKPITLRNAFNKQFDSPTKYKRVQNHVVPKIDILESPAGETKLLKKPKAQKQRLIRFKHRRVRSTNVISATDLFSSG